MRTWFLAAVLVACGGIVLPLAADEPARPSQLTEDERKAKIAERDRLWTEAIRLKDQGQTSDALTRGQQVLAIERIVFGNIHHELTGTLATLAGWHERIGNWVAARSDLKELLALRTALDSAQHWQAIDARLSLARLDAVEKLPADMQRRYLEAGKLLHEVGLLYEHKQYRAAIPLSERAQAIYSELLGADSQLVGDARYWQAYLHFQLGEYETAEPIYREVAEQRLRLLGREHLDTVQCQKVRAQALYHLRRYEEAAVLFGYVALRFDQFEKPDTAAWMHSWLGDCHRDLKDDATAAKAYAVAADRFDKLKLDAGMASSHHELARALYRQKEFAQALPHFERAAPAFDSVGQGVDAAWMFVWQGHCQRDLADHASAAVTYAIAAERFNKLDFPAGLAEAEYQAGRALYRQKEYAQAVERFTRSVTAYERASRPGDAAWSVLWIGHSRRELGDQAAAAEAYADGTARYMALKDQAGQLETLKELAKAQYRLKRYAEAAPLFEQAAALFDALKNPTDAAWMWSWLGDCHRDRKDDPAAMKAYQESLDRFTKLKHEEGIAENSRQIGKALSRLSRKAEAVPHLTQAAKSYEAAGKPLDAADALTRLGLAHSALGNYPQAEEIYLRALDLTRTAVGEEHSDFAWTLSNLASLYKNMGRYTLAKPLQLQALEIRRKLFGDQSASFADSLGQVADLYVRMGHYVRAEQRCQQALEIRRKIHGEEHENVASSLNMLGQIALQRGDHQRAETLCRQALEIRKKLVGERHVNYALSLNSFGLVLEARGDYAGAEPLFRQCLEIIKQVRGVDHPDYANCLNCLALLYVTLGDNARAEPLLVESRDIRKQTLGATHPVYAVALNNLAAFYKGLGEYQRAKPLYEEAREILRRKLGTKHGDYATCIDNLALLHSAMNDLAGAEALFQEALQIYTTTLGPRHPDCARSLNNLAGVYLARREYARAASLYQKANDILKLSLSEQHPMFAASLGNLATVHYRLGNIKRAHGLSRQSLAITNRQLLLISGVQSERQQLATLANFRHGLDGLISLTMRDASLGAGTYEEVLRLKGFVLGQQRAIRAVADRPELAATMEDLRTTATQLATLSFSTPPADEAEEWREQVAELSQRKDDLEGKLAAASREFRSAKAPVDLAAIRAALPPQTALVDFVLYSDLMPDSPLSKENYRQLVRYAAFVVPREGPITFLDLGSAYSVREAVEAWRKDFGATQEAQQAARRLREQIWEPVAAQLLGIKTVLVCPDGDLSRFPLAALPGKEPGTFLLEEDCLLATIPAAQAIPDLLGEQPVRAVQRNLLVLGAVDYDQQGAPIAGPDKKPKKDFRQLTAARGDDSLRFELHAGMKAEPAEITSKYKEIFDDDQFTLLEGGAASEEAVRREAPRHLYLHFATHGFFAPPSVRSAMARDTVDHTRLEGELVSTQSLAGYHPGLLSGIALAGANNPKPGADDGILTAEEVGTLNLTGVQLVVLSACETGLGESAGGEGLLGLQRAFQAAGARTVVGTLWKVPDAATRDLMARFYDNLWNKELGKLAALREAQLWLLRERGSRGLDFVGPTGEAKRLPPYYWAAFVLSGDWR